MTDTFRQQVWISVSFHGAIAILLLFRAFFLPDEPLQIHDSIRVDIVGLPDKIQQSPPKQAIEAPPAKVALPNKPDLPAPALKQKPLNTKKLEKNAFDRLKALEAIDKLKAEKETPKDTPSPKPETFKGNAVANGDSLHGLERYEFDEYFSVLRNTIQQHFHLPQWLAETDLHAQAVAYIDENGYVIRKEIVKSSGNDIFDGMVLDSLEKSSPLTPPPARLVNILKYRGAIFNFPD